MCPVYGEGGISPSRIYIHTLQIRKRRKKKMNTLEEQIALEKYFKECAENIVKKNLADSVQTGQYAQTQTGRNIMNYLINNFVTNIQASIEGLAKKKRGVRPKYLDLLQKYIKLYEDEPEKLYLLLATNTLKNVVNRIMRKKYVLAGIAQEIGEEVEEEVNLYVFMKTQDKAEIRYTKAINQRIRRDYKEKFVRKIYENEKVSTAITSTTSERSALGGQLVEILTESTDFFNIKSTGTKGLLELRPSDIFIQTIQKNEGRLLARAIKYIPTIIPPKGWDNMYHGGYYGVLANKVSFMRNHPYTKNTYTMKRYLARLNELDLSRVYKAVNRIQATPYRINKSILSTITTLMTNGGDRAGLPAMEPAPHLPPFPYTEEEIKQSEELQTLFKEHKKKLVKEIHKENSRKGRALRAIMITSLAKSFAKYESIWFPMNIDFRGRIYPIPTGLNPQGDDMTKGLLEYADPVPVKKDEDLDWLAIHGAGLAGFDKIPLPDRISWVKTNEGNILSSATDPIGHAWWQDMDKPFQFLAWCMEWKNAKEYIKNHNTLVGFLCRCFIAYDGTCSGLQHYSALLRDPIGGSAVNLIDHDKPADIYNEVAQKVLKMVQEDSVNGTLVGKKEGTPGTKQLAQAWLSYGITRKVCKRPVMTLAYGSGQYGFGDQVFEDTTKDNPSFKDIEFPAAQYLAKLIWKGVKTTVVKATEGMQYLKEVAGLLSKEGYPVEWVTPLGLPIQQMYLELKTECFRLRFGGASVRYRIYVTDVKEGEEIDKRKQTSGVAPNFIHSMDAAHLMLVVNSSEGKIRNFTTVHDSFGTSLGEAENMRHIIREQLVKMYTEHDPLQEFKEHAEELLQKEVPEPPSKGNLDINSIISSKFVFH